MGPDAYNPKGKLVHPKGAQSWELTGRTDAEAEAPILWPPDGKSWLTGKDPDAGKDWRQEGKGMTEDEMVGWHHQHNGHGFGWTSGVDDGQGGLVCCGSWGRKQSDTTEQLNWTELNMCQTLSWGEVAMGNQMRGLGLALKIDHEISSYTNLWWVLWRENKVNKNEFILIRIRYCCI